MKLILEHGTFPSVGAFVNYNTPSGLKSEQIYNYQQASFMQSHVTSPIGIGAGSQTKANLMSNYQTWMNDHSAKNINKNWVRFAGYNAGVGLTK